MALLWEKRTAQGHYQVRTAGNTVRLYKDGVFHSHYNPRHTVTRGVWDLLVLPALLHPPGRIQRVLLLGVGGGAAIHLLNRFVQPTHITAIELDSLHLRVAKKYFKVDYANTQLKQGDAIAWVNHKASLRKPPRFDLIIDDLYGEEEGEPVRAVEANTQWCQALHTLLGPNGLLVANFVTPQELRHSAYLNKRTVRRQYQAAYRFTNPLYQNNIGAFSRCAPDTRQFANALDSFKELRTRRFQDSFRYRKIPGFRQ